MSFDDCSADAGGNCALCTQTIDADDRCAAMCGLHRCRRWRADGESMCYQHLRASTKHPRQAAASSSSAASSSPAKRPRQAAVSSSRFIDLTKASHEVIDLTESIEEKSPEKCCVCHEEMAAHGEHERVWLPCFHSLCMVCRDAIAQSYEPEQRRCPLCKTPFDAQHVGAQHVGAQQVGAQAVPGVRPAIMTFEAKRNRAIDHFMIGAMSEAQSDDHFSTWRAHLQRVGPWPWTNEGYRIEHLRVRDEIQDQDVRDIHVTKVLQTIVRYLRHRPPHLRIVQLPEYMQTALLMAELLDLDLIYGQNLPDSVLAMFSDARFSIPLQAWAEDRYLLLDTSYPRDLIQKASWPQ